MRQSSKVQGTKIAQAAKDLNVTSVTIRRYITEFEIPTTTDSNGIKVLPDTALEELQEVRRLKEEGYTNPKVMEFLEEMRAKSGSGSSDKADKKKSTAKPKKETKSSRSKAEDIEEENEEEAEVEVEVKPKASRKVETPASESQETQESEDIESTEVIGEKEGRVKHSLTCQTCGKVFEHMNPKLRDCLDCYRTKRKERRRGGGDRHKTVIQHPIAQQVTSKMASQQANQQNRENQQNQQQERQFQPRVREEAEQTNFNVSTPAQAPVSYQNAASSGPSNQPMVGGLMRKVRSYRKAIEDTRQITGSLKRRLERPDLPEGERRWLEQIYAYQLILHQGWRHLSEYRMATQQQGKDD